jgi:hypothetical protein
MGHTSCRLNDRDFFFDLIAKDTDHKFHVIDANGTIKITDTKFFELQFINFGESLQKTEWMEDWVFAEFTSPNYEKNFRLLDKEFLKTCLLIVVEASQEVVLLRNKNRPLHSTDVDIEQIPDYYILECHKQSLHDIPNLFRELYFVKNESSNVAELARSATEITLSLIEMKV